MRIHKRTFFAAYKGQKVERLLAALAAFRAEISSGGRKESFGEQPWTGRFAFAGRHRSCVFVESADRVQRGIVISIGNFGRSLDAATFRQCVGHGNFAIEDEARCHAAGTGRLELQQRPGWRGPALAPSGSPVTRR